MSEPRDDAARAKNSAGSGGWREFASSALLVAAVIAILAAGLVLRSDRLPGPARPADGDSSPPAALPLGSTITPEPETPQPETQAPAIAQPETLVAPPPSKPVSADPVLEALAVRAEADCARLRKARGPWTAQLLVACKPATVDRAVASARSSAKLYVLPAELRGEACFRVCWGAYANAKDAAAAADLPKALRGKDAIVAVEIARVLP